MTIGESLKRILESESVFGSLFYDVFFARCPEAEAYFDGVDMKRQALVLTMALQMMEQYHSNSYAAIEHYLQHIGQRHRNWLVPKEMYSSWRDALLAALEKFHGDEWGDDLGEEWRQAIEAATYAMFKGYDEHAGI